MIKEHDIVVLTEDMPAEGLTAGDVGTVLHIHNKGEGYEVEFVTLAGQTIAVASLLAPQVRPVSRQDVAHIRELQPAWTTLKSRAKTHASAMAKKPSKTLNGTKVKTDECVIPPALPKTELNKLLFRQSEIEAQLIREYIEWQTHGEEAVLHVEKVASERVFARDYDVWDVHTDFESDFDVFDVADFRCGISFDDHQVGLFADGNRSLRSRR